MKSIIAIDAISIAKMSVSERFCAEHAEGAREHLIRSSLQAAANTMWGDKYQAIVTFMEDFENFLGSGFGIFGGFILRGRFGEMIKTREDAIALLDLFGDFQYRLGFEVIGSREWKEHKHGIWFEIAV